MTATLHQRAPAPHELNAGFRWEEHPGAGRALTAEQRAGFDRDGFVVLERVIPPDVLARAVAEIDELDVAPEQPDAGYDRELFGDWETQPDGCTTRERVLLDEAVEEPEVGAACDVGSGEWESAYDGVTVEDPGELDVDHLVPLAEAWESGASGWTDEQREEFANDLDNPQALIAVTAGSNRSKGDRDPAEWRPPERSEWCDYATAWIDVKAEWGLTAEQRAGFDRDGFVVLERVIPPDVLARAVAEIDPAEVAELEDMLATCPG